MNKIKSFSEFVNESSDTEFSKYSAVNEEGGLLAYFKGVQNYAKLSKLYPKLKEEIKDLELHKVQTGLELDAEIADKVTTFDQTYETKVREKANKIPETKQRQAFRDMMLEKKADKVALYKEKLTLKKTKFDEQMTNEIAQANQDISDAEAEFKIDNPVLSKKYSLEKAEAVIMLDDKYRNLALDAKVAYFKEADKPERAEQALKDAKDRDNKEKKIANETLTRLKTSFANAEQAMQSKIANASEDQQEAATKVKDFTTALKDYIAKAEKYNSDETEDETIKSEYNEASKTLTAAENKLSKSVFVKLGSSPEEAENMLEEYQTSSKEAKESGSSSFGGKGKKIGKEGVDDVDDGFGDDEGGDEYADQKAKDAAETAATADVTKAKEALQSEKDKDLSTFTGADDAAKQVAKTAALEPLEAAVTAAETKETEAKAKKVKAPALQTDSFDTDEFNKFSTLERKKNVLSFEEFVNESRKNGYKY